MRARRVRRRRLGRPAGGHALPESHAEWLVLEELGALVRASLVVPLVSETEPRFTILETTWIFVLDQMEPVKERQLRASHLTALAERFKKADRAWPSAVGPAWRRHYVLDANNARAALSWGFAQCLDDALRLMAFSLPLWLELDSLREAREWFALAIDRASPVTAQHILARLYLGQSWRDDRLGGCRNFAGGAPGDRTFPFR